MMWKSLIVLASLWLLGCASKHHAVPEVGLDVSASCASEEPCISAGAKVGSVEGVRFVHRRLIGAPTLAIHVVFDHPSRAPQQYWAEALALRLLATNGARAYDGSDWRAAVAELGARFQVVHEYDYGEVAITAPAPRWREAARLLTSAVRDPGTTGLDWAIASLKSAHEVELDDPDGASSIHAWSELYEGHHYDHGRSSLSAVDEIDARLVDRAWDALRTTARMHIVVVGDVSWDDAVDALRTLALSAEPSGPDFSAPPDDAPALAADGASLYDYPEARAWHVTAVFRGPAITDPSLPALAVGLGVLDQRLWLEVRERRGLSYSVGAGLWRNRETSGVLWFSTADIAQTIPVVHDTIAALLADGPSADELASSIEILRSRSLSGATTPEDIASWLGAWQVWSGKVADVDGYLRGLDAVTPKQAHDAVKAYVRNIQIVAAGAGEPLDEAALLRALPGHEPTDVVPGG